MTGAEFRAKMVERFPIRDDDTHEESYWWLLLQETAERMFNRAYNAEHPK